MSHFPTDRSGSALLRKARAGERDAINDLLAASQIYVHQIARREMPAELQPRLDADDVTQETLLRAYLSLPSFKGKTWKDWLSQLRRIFRNTCQNILRDGHRKKRDITYEVHFQGGRVGFGIPEDLIITTQTPVEILLRKEERADVRYVLAGLPRRCRRVLWLRFWKGCSYGEIAWHLGGSANAAQKLCQRAQLQVR